MTVRKYGVAFSRDGKYVASAGVDRTIRVWAAASGKLVNSWRSDQSSTSVAFSPDGSEVAAGNGRDVLLWDVRTGRLRSRLKGEDSCATIVAYSAGGQHVVSGGPRGATRWWERATGKVVETVRGQLLGVCPDGRYAAVRRGREVEVWDIPQPKLLRKFAAPEEVGYYGEGSRDSGALSRGGKRLVVPALSTVLALDATSGKALHRPHGHAGPVLLAYADGASVVSAGDRTVRWWDRATGKEVAKADAHARPLVDAAGTRDRKTLATGAADGTVAVWDVARRATRYRYEFERPTRLLLAFSDDGGTLAVLGRNSPVEKPLRLLGARGAVLRVSGFDPNGRALTFLGNHELLFTHGWDAELHSPTLGASRFAVEALSGLGNAPVFASSVGGRVVAVGGRLGSGTAGVRLWERASQRTFWTSTATPGAVTAVTLSADARLVAAGNVVGEIRLWEVASGRELGCLKGGDAVTSLALSPDNRELVSGGGDGSVLVWDLTRRLGWQRPRRPSADDADRLWAELASDRADVAQRAAGELIAGGDDSIVAMRRLCGLVPPERKGVRQLMAELAAKDVQVRERALSRVAWLGEVGVDVLDRAIAGHATGDFRVRLSRIAEGVASGDAERWPQLARAMQVLECIGTRAAARLAEDLAAKHPSPPVRQAARSVAGRCRPPLAGTSTRGRGRTPPAPRRGRRRRAGAAARRHRVPTRPCTAGRRTGGR